MDHTHTEISGLTFLLSRDIPVRALALGAYPRLLFGNPGEPGMAAPFALETVELYFPHSHDDPFHSYKYNLSLWVYEHKVYNPSLSVYDQKVSLSGDTMNDTKKKEKGFGKSKKRFRAWINGLSHHRLSDLRKEIRETTSKKYIEGRPSKIELVERSFDDRELKQFLEVVDDPLYKAAYLMMAVTGLRTGELLSLKGCDIVDGDQLRITSTKGSFDAFIKLPDALLKILPMRESQERLFPINNWTFRKKFAMYRRAAALVDIYARTLPCGPRMTRQRRYRLSLHSLRHYAISKAYELTKDPDLVRRFARHTQMDTTLRYLKSTRKNEVENVMERMSQNLPVVKVEREPRQVTDLNGVLYSSDSVDIVKSAHEECERTKKRALDVYRKGQEECPDPESYFISLMSKWLKDPANRDQIRALGLVSWCENEYPDLITDDFSHIDLPDEIIQSKMDLFYRIQKYGASRTGKEMRS